MYREVSQREYGRAIVTSPPATLSPTLSTSTSPATLLPNIESTFTPLSMDGEDESLGLARGSHEKFPSLSAAARAATTSITSAAQSLASSARATAGTKNLKQNEYDLLARSPGEIGADDSSVLGSPDVDLPSPQFDSAAPLHRPRPQSNIAPYADANDKPIGNRASRTTRTRQDSTNILQRDSNLNTITESPTAIHQPVADFAPLVRTTSTSSVTLRHPAPDLITRSSSRASNIAQLEATAEQLSMTSSTEDAIRDLHDELKRSDSRRSSILASSASGAVGGQFKRQSSGPDSILDINSAARLGGYSPAAYVMSPTNSMSGSRLRSGSYTRSDPDTDASLSRHGPGKSSLRSIKSGTKALGDIAEMESSTSAVAARDGANMLEEESEEEEEEETLRIPTLEDIDATPNANEYGDMGTATDYWSQAVIESRREEARRAEAQPRERPGSSGTFEQAEKAFADFDGAHCSPDAEHFELPNLSGPISALEFQPPAPVMAEPLKPRQSRLVVARPQSYMDPETGQQMLYYPARVPAMLSLPQSSKRNSGVPMNVRRSEVLSMMPGAKRHTGSWLPEIVPEADPEPLLDGLGGGSSLMSPAEEETVRQVIPEDDEQFDQPQPSPQFTNDEKRKSRLSVAMTAMDPAEKRKSQMTMMGNVPAQLRASAFFDLPSDSPKISLINGSATATLDSILDAAASAPVSAFTDHLFAGKLGDEVYGAERRSKPQLARNSTFDVPGVKKRSSFFHLRAPSKLSIHSLPKEDKRHTMLDGPDDRGSEFEGERGDEQQRPSGSINGERETGDDEEDELEEEPENGQVYDGPPTTLLAELQLRKQQQKQRTRLASAHPYGMHATLLEMDSVAEVERRNRLGKRVNLAWEEPGGAMEEGSDEEDLPLGVLMAAKNGKDVRDVQMEMNRPPGLMERREMDDNEPLSRRRDRLQGRDPGPKRQVAMGMSAGLGPSSPNLLLDEAPQEEEEEVEGETLAERMRRLQAAQDGDNPLPRARPVSGAFSVELLSQLGDTFKDEEAAKAEAEKKKDKPVEEEETLGQRRRRLQQEREAREREMASGAQDASPGVRPQLATRQSLADVLGTGSRRVISDPRLDAERAKIDEAARFRADQERKMAALRAQMPAQLMSPNLTRSGGYMAGQFNDGAGGVAYQRQSYAPSSFPIQQPVMGNAYGHVQQQQPGMMSAGMMGNGYNMGGMMGYGAPMAQGYGMMPMQMQFPMQVQQPGQQYDRVDRWRQNIIP